MTYENDDLDQNAALEKALGGLEEGARPRVETVRLEGNHLTPVVLALQGGKLGAISVGKAEAARALAQRAAAWLARP